MDEDESKNFDCVRKILVDEFRDLDSKPLVDMLDILDDLIISFRTQDFSLIIDKVELLREDIFKLIKEKKFRMR